MVRGHAFGLLWHDALAQGQLVGLRDVLGRTSDVDAVLKLENGETLAVRWVRVRLALVNRRGEQTGEQERWYVTNLERQRWDADVISSASRLRWLVERAFRRCKHAARMDHLQTSRPTAVMARVGAALLVSALAERVHRELAREEGITKVSLERCLLAFASALPRMIQLLITAHTGRAQNFDGIARIVTHESRHPNPGHPHLVGQVFCALEEAASSHEQRTRILPDDLQRMVRHASRCDPLRVRAPTCEGRPVLPVRRGACVACREPRRRGGR